ncbi:MAG TPA: endonuclease MutS2 [Sphingobacteriaceae bacterium]|nr:endonuclease MutS2 [Sphingobacteriaceae bacterium]
MIYPENTLDKLGFSDIRDRIREKCLSSSGKELVDKIQPQYRFDTIDLFLRQTHEFKDLLVNDSVLSVDNLFPIRPLAEKIKIEGVFLSEEEFFQLFLSLKTVFGIIRYFQDRSGQYPNLEALFENLPVEKSLLPGIGKVIDEKGKIRKNASPMLAELQASISKAEQEAHRKIEQLFKHAQSQGWTADGNLTVRDGRLCIPILAENKRKVKGFVHDESASGQTAYIEPEEVFHLNNKLRDLEFDRRREIIRILTALTDEIRPHVPLLFSYHGLQTKVDFVRAKALFALDIDANMPELAREASLNLVNAEHPLLKLAFRKESGQIVVPLNIRLDQEDRIIVVSGPNAGGKSVCMKTVGLLQLMTQSGILIPADPTSRMGIFRSFFADIGDDQSIESDLSTYSAHLTKMRYFTEHADSKSLVLIDEFGTGTDPMFGGPIAEAVLEVLNRKKVRGVITTHYSNLKVYAGNTKGLQNASMLFDNAAMKPLYILQIGKPGSSYAFEIAQKIGLSKEVLESARQKVGKQQKRIDTLLVDLEREKNEIYTSKKALEKQEAKLVRLQSENEQLQEYLEANKKTILKEAKQEAKNIIQQANKLIENTVAEIKVQKAEKEKTKELRNVLKEELDKLGLDGHLDKKLHQKSEEPLKMGDWVRIIETGNEAQVIEIAKNNVILAMGELRTVQKLKNLQKLEKKEIREVSRRTRSHRTQDASTFSPEIDVRGMRTEAALYEIEKVLDQAIMLGYPNLKIVHGKGDGILRRFIREYLRKYSQISRLEDEHPDRGGDGITYAYLG